MLTAVCVALICAAFSLSTASAQTAGEPLISPTAGAAGSLFQIVGQGGWTPGETVTLRFTFSDTEPNGQPVGPFYHERQVTVLRDGSWSFPIVVNADLFPFPLYRPGFIVVTAQSATKTAVNSYVYTVGGVTPQGLPPLAELGSGPGGGSNVPAVAATLALFAAAAGALLALSGAMRRSGSVG